MIPFEIIITIFILISAGYYLVWKDTLEPILERHREGHTQRSQVQQRSNGHTEPAQIVKPLQRLSRRQWVAMLNEDDQRIPHALITGSTGMGKTTIAAALLAERWGYICILTGKVDDAWPMPFVSYDADGSTSALQQTIAMLVNHLRTRDEHTPPLTLVIDDLPMLSAEQELKKPLVDLIARTARVGRSKHMRLLVISQEAGGKATGLEGQLSVLQNMARIEVVSPDEAILSATSQRYIMRTKKLPYLARQSFDDLQPWYPDEYENESEQGAMQQGQVWTDQHIKVAAMLSQTPGISTRAIARALYPDTDGGGSYSVSARQIREQVEAMLCVTGVTAVTEQPHNTP